MAYRSLKSCKDRFSKGCRPLLGFDGCFLKGYLKGMLLVAVGIDPNHSYYPVAFVVVEKENTSSWTWFLHLLSEDLQIKNPSRNTMINIKDWRRHLLTSFQVPRLIFA